MDPETMARGFALLAAAISLGPGYHETAVTERADQLLSYMQHHTEATEVVPPTPEEQEAIRQRISERAEKHFGQRDRDKMAAARAMAAAQAEEE
jgi:hypothetical protein